jgi:hypothetical protein
MGDFDFLPGPNPSTLRTVDHVPKSTPELAGLKVTYTSQFLTDYVRIERYGRGLALYLEPTLFDAVWKVKEAVSIQAELYSALKAIGIGGLTQHLIDTVFQYAGAVLPSIPAVGVTSIPAVAWLLRKLYEKGVLTLGVIHQASITELPSWMGFIQEAMRNPDISVCEGNTISPG